MDIGIAARYGVEVKIIAIWGYFGMRCKKGRSYLNDRTLEGSAQQLTSCQYLQSHKGTVS